jgi:pimeloyl-ACP methyl ester carboxylesterase
VSNTIHGTSVTYHTTPDLQRRDLTIESEPGVNIFVRQVSDPRIGTDKVPLLLLHGARASSVPSFDLDVTGGSLAADLARAGHPVYLMDARGYGGSTRPDATSRPPEESEPLTRSSEVVRDIAPVVEYICAILGVEQVAVMGWATGSQWLAHYAASTPSRVSHLILYNSVWPVNGSWPIGNDMEDPDNPGELKPGALSGYGFATADSLLGRWDGSIPVSDPDEWRDPAVAKAYATTAISADPTSTDRKPPSLRTPLGALADTFYLSREKPPFDPAAITAKVLVVRSELDFWSREVDFVQPVNDLASAERVEPLEIPNATHFVHLDRWSRGRAILLDAVQQFVAE